MPDEVNQGWVQLSQLAWVNGPEKNHIFVIEGVHVWEERLRESHDTSGNMVMRMMWTRMQFCLLPWMGQVGYPRCHHFCSMPRLANACDKKINTAVQVASKHHPGKMQTIFTHQVDLF